MRQDQTRQLAALVRARNLLDAGPFADLNATPARKQLDEAIEAVNSLGVEQEAANRLLTGQLAEEKALAKALRMNHVRPIATLARAMTRDHPDMGGLSGADCYFNSQELVTAARSMVRIAEPYTEMFAAAAFPSDVLTQLTLAADAVANKMAERSETFASRVGATARIAVALGQGQQAVQTIHAAMIRNFADDQDVLEAWQAARRVEAKPGVKRGKSRRGDSASLDAPKPDSPSTGDAPASE